MIRGGSGCSLNCNPSDAKCSAVNLIRNDEYVYVWLALKVLFMSYRTEKLMMQWWVCKL